MPTAGPDSPDGLPADDVERLTRAVAAGDERALEQLYRSRFDSMYGYANAITRRDETFCLDVVQDTMMRVIRSLRPLRSESQLDAWLRRAVRSAAIDRLRAEDRRARRERGYADAAPARSEPTGATSEERRWLANELATMDRRVSSVLAQRFGLGWTLQRIADHTRASPGAVDGRIGRALAELRRRAKEHFDG